ncbi:serpentine receptor [Reticulomyxa filosa]|uniref:Serpentine receptor n=1 Tax=Reticulomyxa filosa TaxID=46433 RepID=X6LK24_RETFI|nr:serpentine receptor [Reticulomyxa filosa]|eukprot:ETO01075.1 serpentine receptor [Reticulomyxa filosa]
MSKQVQRFSTDIKSTVLFCFFLYCLFYYNDEQVQELKQRLARQKAEKENAPFPEHEMEVSWDHSFWYPKYNSSSTLQEGLFFICKNSFVRVGWGKGGKVQIFSNTHQEWYTAEIIDVMKDEEGEWLNVVWNRENGEAMSKQVQRFSTDVRPVPIFFFKKKKGETTKNPILKKLLCTENGETEEKKPVSQNLDEEIKQRKLSFKRRAPPFARTCTGVLWQYPATQNFRRAKKLDDVEENPEGEEEDEAANEEKQKEVGGKQEIPLDHWANEQVCEWLKSLGSAYEKYVPKFRTIDGEKLKQMNEEKFIGMGLPALHAVKLSLEIQRQMDKSISKVDLFFFLLFVVKKATFFFFKKKKEVNTVDVLNWKSADIKKWAEGLPPLNQYASKFESHGIDGVLLFELNTEDLALIGVRQLHCKKILEIIQTFSKQIFPNFAEKEEDEENEDEDEEEEEEEVAELNHNNNKHKEPQLTISLKNINNINNNRNDEKGSNKDNKVTENGVIHDDKGVKPDYEGTTNNNNLSSHKKWRKRIDASR